MLHSLLLPSPQNHQRSAPELFSMLLPLAVPKVLNSLLLPFPQNQQRSAPELFSMLLPQAVPDIAVLHRLLTSRERLLSSACKLVY